MYDKLNDKDAIKSLITIFNDITGLNSDLCTYKLNGSEGLLVWENGRKRFYQMSYKDTDVWNITLFPYDIYDMKIWNEDKSEWTDKE